MPVNSYQPDGLPTIDWSKHRERPSDVDVRIDVAALQADLDVLNEHPIRWLTGTFSCPKASRPDQYEKVRNQAVAKFVRAMELQGWDLYGRIAVYVSAFPVTEPGGTVIQEDRQEYAIKALFRKKNWQPTRIELPSYLVRRN